MATYVRLTRPPEDLSEEMDRIWRQASQRPPGGQKRQTRSSPRNGTHTAMPPQPPRRPPAPPRLPPRPAAAVRPEFPEDVSDEARLLYDQRIRPALSAPQGELRLEGTMPQRPKTARNKRMKDIKRILGYRHPSLNASCKMASGDVLLIQWGNP